MFFDGMYSLVQSFFILASGFIVSLLFRKDDERFQFGYSAFEPFFIVIRSAVLLTMNLSIAYGAIVAIIKGGYLIDTTLALGFSLVSVFVCLATYLILSHFAKKLHSPVLKAEARSWFLDTGISLASVFAIAGIGIAQKTGHQAIAFYIDPVITLIFILSLSPLLSGQLRDSTRELLGGAPPEKIQKKLKRIVHSHVRENDFLKDEVFAAKQGRSLSITAYIYLKKEMPLKQLDLIRKDILSDLQQYCSWSEADIVFTIDSSWVPFSQPSAISELTS
jgi:predicted Co/Zn/Cd cation transporter (cation efflux family)